MRPGSLLFIFWLMSLAAIVNAQPGTTIDLKKPAKYESRTLTSENTKPGKIGFTRKFFQNTFSHYNYYFNANNRLNAILTRAQLSFKDDYTKLLPYYDYTLDMTATDPDLDSVIYKCNAGILLHDLRSDWVDDLYFLMGKAYYLRKNFDSAQHVFLYINYAFAPKDDGYDVPIGSNANSTEFSIATKEKSGFKELLKKQPRRNEDLIWVAKNYIDAGKPYEGSAILEILKNDPNFPDRLQPELHETFGYLFYQERIYDSAAYHLSKATDLDDNKQEKARREYLAAQLYTLAGDNENAQKYFARSADHAVDPVMEIYADINKINSSSDTTNAVDKKIASLLHLAQRDKFVSYRDLIYYNAALAEVSRNNTTAAITDLKKSVKYTVDNPVQRSLSFMMLGDLTYDKPDYIAAKNFYDSVEAGNLKDSADQKRLTSRLTPLETIAGNLQAIHNEDSLQAIAKMPEAQRTAYIKKEVRLLRKAQGLKDADTSVFINPAVQSTLTPGTQGSTNSTDLFAATNNAKGDWYFNNQQLMAAGQTSFKTTWGNRPNVDNWQRIDAVNKQIAQQATGGLDPDHAIDSSDLKTAGVQGLSGGTGEISYDALLANIPLTQEQVKASDTKIADALFSNAQTFQNQLEDYYAAIANYDSLNTRFPDNSHLEESLAGLYYCYNKIGKKASADSVLTALKTKFKDGSYTKLINNRASTKNKNKQEDSATKAYEHVYDLFIEGKFDEAKALKTKEDSVYGNSYWTPQLLYIESIYFVSKREDSSAIEQLTNVTGQFASSPLADKAQTMIDVLRRRKEIEAYLTNLKITRLPEDEPAPIVNLNPVENIIEKKETKKDSIVSKQPAKVTKLTTDTIKGIAGAVKTYVFNASDSQYVGILLDKVDPVYANEARNAFNRFNQMNFYSQKINVVSSKVSDSLTLVLLGPFSDASSALIYVDRVKPQAGSSIIPWLKPDKYSFTIISQSNLDILNNTKDLQDYKSLLQKVLPGKF